MMGVCDLHGYELKHTKKQKHEHFLKKMSLRSLSKSMVAKVSLVIVYAMLDGCYGIPVGC